MDSKIAGILSLLGAAALLAIWWVFLFAARPDCFDSLELVVSSAKFVLSPSEPGSWLFWSTLVSIVTCIATALLLFFGKQKVSAMYFIAMHAAVAFFIYTWSLFVAIALPLIYFNKVRKNA